MKFVRELLSAHGGISTLRVMSLTCVIAACGLAAYGISLPVVDYSGLTLLCGAFLSAGFTGKVLQKKSESRSLNSQETP